MAQDEIKQLREKLEKQEQQFENYREECKVLENFLEEESQKKEQEIRKLKEDAIVKQKNYKLLKSENSQLKSEINNLKDQLASKDQFSQSSQKYQEQEVIKLKAEVEELKAKLNDNSKNEESSSEKIKSLEEQIAEKAKQNQQIQNKLNEKIKEFKQNGSKGDQLEQTLKNKQAQINELNKMIKQLGQQINQKVQQIQNLTAKNSEFKSKIKNQKTDEYKKTIKKEEKPNRDKLLEKQLEKAEEKIKRYEMKIQKMQIIIKQLKHKLNEAKVTLSPQKGKEQTEQSPVSKIFTGCLITTKPYYISPFLEVNAQTKVIKIYKASRHGCFEKSLGVTKHKLDAITYQQNVIINDIVSKITGFQEDHPHFVMIFGSKKTSKKTLMTEMIAKMFEFLKQKLQSCSTSDVSAIYVRKTADQQLPDERSQALTTQEILQLLHSIMNANQPISPRKIWGDSGQKKMEKPRLAYFNIRINEFCLQIATSSFTHIQIRQKDSLSTFYNNVLYSKLSDVLQSSYGQKYIILTVNPIVDLYEDCKNVLNVSQYRVFHSLTGKSEDDGKQIDINKQMLNAMARKKLEQLQRQLENNNIKIRKIEDECFFYKIKFQELEERLKNLISTHHNQNSYLRKSPILLSYEKMLKFIHSVQTKYSSGQETGSNVININDIDFESDISMEAM